MLSKGQPHFRSFKSEQFYRKFLEDSWTTDFNFREEDFISLKLLRTPMISWEILTVMANISSSYTECQKGGFTKGFFF